MAFDFVPASSQRFYKTSPSSTVRDNLTAMGWVFLDSNNQDATFFANAGYNGGSSTGWSAHMGGSGVHTTGSRLILDLPGVAWFDTGYASLAANSWFHLTLQRSTGTWQYYVNAVAQGSTTTATPNALTAGTAVLSIGAEIQSDGVSWWKHLDGKMAEVKYWESVLSLAQIELEMRNHKFPTVNLSTLKFYNALDRESAVSPVDFSQSGNSMSNNGSPAPSQHRPF